MNEVRRRLRGKQNIPHMPSQALVPATSNVSSTNFITPQQQALQPLPEQEERIQIHGKTLTRTRPALDLKEFPKKLIHAPNDTDRAGLLQLLHEKFWHASPTDMVKLLTGMLLPRDIVLQGADVARNCETCNKWHQKLYKP